MEDEFGEKALSARRSHSNKGKAVKVEKKKEESESSEEFNIDDALEESKAKPEDRKVEVSKNGGYRDYSTLKMAQPVSSSKMIYMTHD